MELNLRQDAKTISANVSQRISDYPIYVNSGPGKDDARINRITLGFSYEQSGWVAAVFDTRPKAANDGQWQMYIDENCIEFDNWCDAWETVAEGNDQIDVTLPNGKKTIHEGAEPEELASVIGTVLKGIALKAIKSKSFTNLHLAKNCVISVDDHDGYFNWESFVDGRKPKESWQEAQERRKMELKRKIKKLSRTKQIEYWIGQLNQHALGKKCELDKVFEDDTVVGWGNKFAIAQLAEIGKSSVIPLLKAYVRWSKRCEFIGDRPGDVSGSSTEWLLFPVIRFVEESKVATPEVEKLLIKAGRNSVAANKGRKLWGTAPPHTAGALYELFDGYPVPHMSSSGNVLSDPDQFFG